MIIEEDAIIAMIIQAPTSISSSAAAAVSSVSSGIDSEALATREYNNLLGDYLRELETPHYDGKSGDERDRLLNTLELVVRRLKAHRSKIKSAEQALTIQGIGNKRSLMVRSFFNFFVFSS
jgi:hypothetical protein